MCFSSTGSAGRSGGEGRGIAVGGAFSVPLQKQRSPDGCSLIVSLFVFFYGAPLWCRLGVCRVFCVAAYASAIHGTDVAATVRRLTPPLLA